MMLGWLYLFPRHNQPHPNQVVETCRRYERSLSITTALCDGGSDGVECFQVTTGNLRQNIYNNGQSANNKTIMHFEMAEHALD